ncbi:hypothetical protein HNY73_004375 [Argiope bruennichi]|uniref:Uncharacterized protein n=1 Tax=Argiope bruennichi TaxID=94029 RepID=A0A8T0FQF9_ARGBR|nr:hypothetical protein HNY73_004375 [Argiope bruennichi]
MNGAKIKRNESPLIPITYIMPKQNHHSKQHKSVISYSTPGLRAIYFRDDVTGMCDIVGISSAEQIKTGWAQNGIPAHDDDITGPTVAAASIETNGASGPHNTDLAISGLLLSIKKKLQKSRGGNCTRTLLEIKITDLWIGS